MPRLIVTPGAARGLERCRRFSFDKNPHAAVRVASTIAHHLLLLVTKPEMGRPFSDAPELRELPIGFGASGYVVGDRSQPGTYNITGISVCDLAKNCATIRSPDEVKKALGANTFEVTP